MWIAVPHRGCLRVEVIDGDRRNAPIVREVQVHGPPENARIRADGLDAHAAEVGDVGRRLDGSRGAEDATRH